MSSGTSAWDGRDFDGTRAPDIALATTNTVAIPQEKRARYVAANSSSGADNE
jgi:hypothetical protein